MKVKHTKALQIVAENADVFGSGFGHYLSENLSVWDMFEKEALVVAKSGRKHYSAYTIREYIRHHTAADENSIFKISNNHTPDLARLFVMVHPKYGKLFTLKASSERGVPVVSAA